MSSINQLKKKTLQPRIQYVFANSYLFSCGFSSGIYSYSQSFNISYLHSCLRSCIFRNPINKIAQKND